MPNTYNFAEDGSCIVTSEDELRQVVLPTYNPSTLKTWANQQELKTYVERSTNRYLWTYIADLPTQEETDARAAIVNRAKRNQLLADSDWTQMNDSPLTNELKTAWATYRQSLRDITADESWPNVTFPATP